jgi:hypothetical protein
MTIFTPPEKENKYAFGNYRYLLYIIGKRRRDCGIPPHGGSLHTTKPTLTHPICFAPNDGASAAAHLRYALILAEKTKLHFLIRTRRLGGQPQARVGLLSIYFISSLILFLAY